MYPSTSSEMYHHQDTFQRKLPATTTMTSQPEPLKVFLQHRIRTVISKEWWDFVVNVNNMNSDHASLLYSVANLCPSFQYFLRTRDKEINIILQKRPQIKPRIFSGSERPDLPLEPSQSSQAPSSQKKSCSTELDKILNELYPNETPIIKRKPRTFGPISKQKKTILNKKFPLASSQNDTLNDSFNDNDITLAKLLREDNCSTTTYSGNSFNRDHKNKVEYSVSGYDINRNTLSLNKKKKKIIKVKKKIMTYTDNNDKRRTKYLLESETPELKREQIKRYRIKKCSVVVKRLSRNQIEAAMRPAVRSMPPISSSIDDAPSVVPNSNSLSPIKNTVISHSSLLPVSLSNEVTMTPSVDKTLINTKSSTISPSPPPSDTQAKEKPIDKMAPEKDKMCAIVSVPQKDSEGQSERITIKIRSNQKENVAISDKYMPKELNKELKTVYCHGGIVPLGKKNSPDRPPFDLNKHFLSLKDKKLKDSFPEVGEAILPLKEKNVLSNTEAKPESVNPTVVKANEINGDSSSKVSDMTLETKPLISKVQENISEETSNKSLNDSTLVSDKANDSFESEKENESFESEKVNESLESEKVNESFESEKVNESFESEKVNESFESDNTNSSSEKEKSMDSLTCKKTNDCLESEKNFDKSSCQRPNDSDDAVCNSSDDKSTDSQKSEEICGNSDTTVECPDILDDHDESPDNSLIIDESCETEDPLPPVDPSDKTDVHQDLSNADPECEAMNKDDKPIATNGKDMRTEPLSEDKEDPANDSDDDLILIETENEIIELDSDDENIPIAENNKPNSSLKVKEEPMEDETVSVDLSSENSSENTSNEKERSIKKVMVINNGDKVESINGIGDSDEPSAKRPRIELNLTEMKIEIKAKPSPKVPSTKDFSCRLCKQAFDSLGDWLGHLDNEVPKCTPNLKVSWEIPEIAVSK